MDKRMKVSRLAVTDFDDARQTRKFSRAVPIRVSEVVRPNRLFSRLSAALGAGAAEAHVAVVQLMERADAQPHTLSHAQLVAIAPGLLEIVETLLPEADRPSAREQLCQMLVPEG
jgi:hypothetical protein